MTFTIPHANGLAEELSKRVQGALSLSDPLVWIARGNDSSKITRLDVLVNRQRIGTVEIESYEYPPVRTTTPVPRIKYVKYDGKIPGYVNPTGTDDVMMIATEELMSEVSYEFRRFDVENNTREYPLRRRDGIPLRLADFERD